MKHSLAVLLCLGLAVAMCGCKDKLPGDGDMSAAPPTVDEAPPIEEPQAPEGSVGGEDIPDLGSTGDSNGTGGATRVGDAVLCVHGWSGNRARWSSLFEYLKEHGFQRVYAVDLPERGLTGSMEEYGDYLGDEIGTLADRGVERVFLVSHSMGGLVCRQYLRSRATNTPAVPCLITLGTPHHGTQLFTHPSLEILPNTTRLQMNPDSDYLRGLNAAGPPLGTSVYCVWTAGDLVIIPNSSCLLSFATNYRICIKSPTAHLDMPEEREVWEIVRAILEGKPRAPTGPQRPEDVSTLSDAFCGETD